jgi:hypothetical protein
MNIYIYVHTCVWANVVRQRQQTNTNGRKGAPLPVSHGCVYPTNLFSNFDQVHSISSTSSTTSSINITYHTSHILISSYIILIYFLWIHHRLAPCHVFHTSSWENVRVQRSTVRAAKVLRVHQQSHTLKFLVNVQSVTWQRFSHWLPEMVNSPKKRWKDPPFLIGNSIAMLVYQRVNHQNCWVLPTPMVVLKVVTIRNRVLLFVRP